MRARYGTAMELARAHAECPTVQYVDAVVAATLSTPRNKSHNGAKAGDECLKTPPHSKKRLDSPRMTTTPKQKLESLLWIHQSGCPKRPQSTCTRHVRKLRDTIALRTAYVAWKVHSRNVVEAWKHLARLVVWHRRIARHVYNRDILGWKPSPTHKAYNFFGRPFTFRDITQLQWASFVFHVLRMDSAKTLHGHQSPFAKEHSIALS